MQFSGTCKKGPGLQCLTLKTNNKKKYSNFFQCLLTKTTFKIFILSPQREPGRQELAWGEVLNSYLYSLHGELSPFHELKVSLGYRDSQHGWLSGDLQGTVSVRSYHRHALQAPSPVAKTLIKKFLKRNPEPRISCFPTTLLIYNYPKLYSLFRKLPLH